MPGGRIDTARQSTASLATRDLGSDQAVPQVQLRGRHEHGKSSREIDQLRIRLLEAGMCDGVRK